MTLPAVTVALIRDEIGVDPDFADNAPHTADQLDSLENIYGDSMRGDGSPLRTALICWRMRLSSLQARSFDITTEGSLLNRQQRIRFLERQVWRLERLVDETLTNRNMVVEGMFGSGGANSRRYNNGAEF